MIFFFSSRRRHTRLTCNWSSDVCSSDLSLRSLAFRSVGARSERTGAREAGVLASPNGQPSCSAGMPHGGFVPCLGWLARSEERRVGKEGRSRGWPCLEKRQGVQGLGRRGGR